MVVKGNTRFILLLFLIFTLFTTSLNGTVFAEEVKNVSKVSVIGLSDGGVILNEKIVPLTGKQTALDVLTAAVGENNVKYEESDYGKYITSINGVNAEGTLFWSFIVNGVSAQVGAESYIVQNGDNLTFQLVDWTVTLESTTSLTILGNNDKGTIKDVSDISYLDGATAFELLHVVMGPEKIAYSDSQYGKMITSIDGLASEGTYYWALYVNGEMASEGADSYKLKKGDKISFKYESWEASKPEKETLSNQETSKQEGVSKEKIQSAIDLSSKYVLSNNVGDWEAVSLIQSGKTIPATYLKSVEKTIIENEGKFNRITDYERYTIGIVAAGGNPLNVGGYNLVKAIYNGDVSKQGLNGVIFALIALDSGDFDIPANAIWTREKLVNKLLEKQNSDGGWSWDGSAKSDIDTTAMVLTALSAYADDANVQTKIKVAIDYLSNQYRANKVDNSSTASQTIIALSALGLDANAELFSMNGTTLLGYLLSFQNLDGGFDYQGGDVSDIFSTDQGLRGIVAYHIFQQNGKSLYDLPFDESVLVTESALSSENKREGKPLPNTATQSYNFILIGLILLLIGVAMYVSNRKKKGAI